MKVVAWLSALILRYLAEHFENIFGNICNFVLVVTKDKSSLKIAWQISFQGSAVSATRKRRDIKIPLCLLAPCRRV